MMPAGRSTSNPGEALELGRHHDERLGQTGELRIAHLPAQPAELILDLGVGIAGEYRQHARLGGGQAAARRAGEQQQDRERSDVPPRRSETDQHGDAPGRRVTDDTGPAA